MNFLYNTATVNTASGIAVTILSGTGTRTFTNRFGTSTTVSFTVAPSGTVYADNLLYLNSSLPFDSHGLTLNLTSPVQLPGHGPAVLYSALNLYNQSGIIGEGGSFRVDGLGSAFLSTVPGFFNVTIGAANVNSLAPTYGTWQSSHLIHQRSACAHTAVGVQWRDSHLLFVTSSQTGVNYSVSGNLTFTTTSAFANTADSLGNPYQTVISVNGTRLYTYLPTGAQLRSTVSGVTTSAYANADQRFYPYSLLGAAPGVYFQNTAPFFDYDGVEFGVSPPVPALGSPLGLGTQYNATSLYFTTSEATAVLTEGYYLSLPVVTYQQQSYSFSA